MDAIFEALRTALDSGGLFSSVLALFLAYIGGILSSFTPCIYPIIPITVGYIGSASEKSVRQGSILSIFYVLGMSSVYTVLGILAAFSGKIFGTLTNTMEWYLVIGLILVISSFWMMDFVKFDPNVYIERFSSWLRRGKAKKVQVHSHEAKKNPHTAFALGVTSGFIAAPCTTPVLTTILTFIATKQSIVFGGLLMFFFAIGLGTLLIFIGTFTGALKVLPKSGSWLNTVKVGSGIIILGLGLYFIFQAGVLS